MPEQLANWDFQWSQVVGQAWADDSFKRRLFANPTATLKEYGMDLPSGFQVEVLEETQEVPENTGSTIHLVLPPRPSAEDLLEEDLVSEEGGHAFAYCHHCGCHRCYGCWRCY